MNATLSSSDVATLLDCEVSTVERLAREGALPAVKYGRSWVFPTQALIEHINAAAVQAVLTRAPQTTPARHRAVLQTSVDWLACYDAVVPKPAKRPDLSGMI